jgi:hypothetical protein
MRYALPRHVIKDVCKHCSGIVLMEQELEKEK